MAKNSSLIKAKDEKKDEFYTQYGDIQAELNHYTSYFKDKVILCNCDDPFESNFFQFFIRNFNFLKLKRLICTCYKGSPVNGTQLSFFDDVNELVTPAYGYVFDIEEVPMANNRGITDSDITALLLSRNSGVKRLKGSGDFNSNECLQYLKEADVVVTNPPFSKFREFVETLIEYGKDFLIIGPMNCITYKEIFPLFMDNKMWTGYGFRGGNAYFKTPEENRFVAGVYNKETGLVKFRNCAWFTNIDIDKRHEDIILYRTYNKEDFPTYDNYDAINVNKVAEIPKDYHGVMGVPITFIEKYNPEQFEIIGIAKRGPGDPKLRSKTYTKEDYENYSDLNAGPVLNIDGKLKNTYPRILIKRRGL